MQVGRGLQPYCCSKSTDIYVCEYRKTPCFQNVTYDRTKAAYAAVFTRAAPVELSWLLEQGVL